MRQGQQHRRGRGRHNNNQSNQNNNRKNQNPLTRSFESNGPDVKVRGTPAHVAEKYLQLARDAQSAGDPVLAENYLQHAEHYNRIILAFREQQMQQGGETMNGGGHHRGRPHMDPVEGDDFADDDGVGDDPGQGEQPMITRFPHELQRQADVGRAEGGQGEGFGQQRQHRHEQQGRYRDRFERQHDRPERQDHRQFDRPERGNGGDRPERQGERFEQHGERQHRQDRFGDRQQRFAERRERHQAERQERHERQDRYERQPYQPPHQPAGERFGVEPPASVERPLPEPRAADPVPVARERSADIPGTVAVEPTPVEPVAAAREPAPPRRRERFASNDQPEFLRRPVRRSRREAEPTAEVRPAADEPAKD